MAVVPAIYNIRPQRRADFPLTLKFKDSQGSPMNLTGWTIFAQIWKLDRSSKIGDFTVNIVTPSAGEVSLLLPYSLTTILPEESRWDVMLVAPSGLREYYIEGTVYPSEGYTVPL